MVVESPLLERLRGQEHASVAGLVDAHYDRVCRYLARLVGDAEAAADLTQETFLRAYQALPRLADDANLSGWLFRIATNLARQRHRRGRVVGFLRLDDEGEAACPGGFEDAVAEQDELRRALARLPLEHRACL